MRKFILLALIGSVLLTACQNESLTLNTETVWESSPQPATPNVTSPLIPRAQGKAETGVLQIVPANREEISQLGAPSCYGKETDYLFKADYKVVFKPNSGKEQEGAVFNSLQIIREYEDMIPLDGLKISGIEMFYFIPVKNQCRPSELYMFGVDQTGDAFQIGFVADSNPTWTASIMADYQPQVANDLLVIKTAEGEDIQLKDIIYKYNVEKKIFERTNR